MIPLARGISASHSPMWTAPGSRSYLAVWPHWAGPAGPLPRMAPAHRQTRTITHHTFRHLSLDKGARHMRSSSISKSAMWILMGLLILGLGGFGVTNLGGGITRIGSVGDTVLDLSLIHISEPTRRTP